MPEGNTWKELSGTKMQPGLNMEMSFPPHNEQIASKVHPFPCHSQGGRRKEECSAPQQRHIYIIGKVSFSDTFFMLRRVFLEILMVLIA